MNYQHENDILSLKNTKTYKHTLNLPLGIYQNEKGYTCYYMTDTTLNGKYIYYFLQNMAHNKETSQYRMTWNDMVSSDDLPYVQIVNKFRFTELFNDFDKEGFGLAMLDIFPPLWNMPESEVPKTDGFEIFIQFHDSGTDNIYIVGNWYDALEQVAIYSAFAGLVIPSNWTLKKDINISNLCITLSYEDNNENIPEIRYYDGYYGIYEDYLQNETFMFPYNLN